MKSIAALGLLAATVAAQSPDELRGQLPECALSCIEQAAESVGCESGDFACECERQEEITAAATTCQLDIPEEERCDATELGEAMDVAAQICEAVQSGDDGATESGADASATESGADASSTDEEDQPTETGEEEPEETGADDSADDTSGDDSGDQDAEGEDEEGAAMKLNGYGWAGAAAAAVALIF